MHTERVTQSMNLLNGNGCLINQTLEPKCETSNHYLSQATAVTNQPAKQIFARDNNGVHFTRLTFYAVWEICFQFCNWTSAISILNAVQNTLQTHPPTTSHAAFWHFHNIFTSPHFHMLFSKQTILFFSHSKHAFFILYEQTVLLFQLQKSRDCFV